MIKYKLLKIAHNRLFRNTTRFSFTKNGEDMFLLSLLQNRLTGFFIDIGCYDPIAYSNTYLFYLRGWRGINIDANDQRMKTFDRVRPLDTNLHMAVSNKEGTIDYYEIDGDDSMNTISKDFVDDVISEFGNKVKAIKKVPCARLSTILDQNVPLNQDIDFISIDVEGAEMDILESNNWNKYNFKAIIIETQINITESHDNKVVAYLTNKGYELYACIPLNKKVANLVFTNKSLFN